MKILIDIGHPAHVHYSRNAIIQWKKKGHEVIVTSRDKKVIKELLEFYNIPFINRGKGKSSRIGKFIYLLQADLKLLIISLKYKPDIYLSFSSPYAAQVAYILRKPHIAFNDTEHTDKIHWKFTYPFSSVIITPQSYQNDLGDKQIRFNNIDDGLYLHPNYYKPNKGVLDELGLIEGQEYVIIRFVSWNAHHDFGQSGLDIEAKRNIISLLKDRFQLFISSEDELPEEFKPYQINISPQNMHDALAYATLFVGESGTMASESAYLGTNSVYINSLPLMCYLKLEKDYGLVEHFKSSDGVVEYLRKLIIKKELKSVSIARSAEMKESFIDPTQFLVWFIENYPESIKIIRSNPDYQQRFI